MADSGRLQELIEQATLFTLGAVSATAEGVRKLVDDMVKRGEMTKPEAERFTRRMAERAAGARDEMRQRVKEHFDELVRNAGLVTKADLAALQGRIEELEKRAPRA